MMDRATQEVKQAAKNLLDNVDFRVMIEYQRRVLADDILSHTEDKEILAARRKYDALVELAEDITQLGEE